MRGETENHQGPIEQSEIEGSGDGAAGSSDGESKSPLPRIIMNRGSSRLNSSYRFTKPAPTSSFKESINQLNFQSRLEQLRAEIEAGGVGEADESRGVDLYVDPAGSDHASPPHTPANLISPRSAMAKSPTSTPRGRSIEKKSPAGVKSPRFMVPSKSPGDDVGGDNSPKTSKSPMSVRKSFPKEPMKIGMGTTAIASPRSQGRVKSPRVVEQASPRSPLPKSPKDLRTTHRGMTFFERDAGRKKTLVVPGGVRGRRGSAGSIASPRLSELEKLSAIASQNVFSGSENERIVNTVDPLQVTAKEDEVFEAALTNAGRRRRSKLIQTLGVDTKGKARIQAFIASLAVADSEKKAREEEAERWGFSDEELTQPTKPKETPAASPVTVKKSPRGAPSPTAGEPPPKSPRVAPVSSEDEVESTEVEESGPERDAIYAKHHREIKETIQLQDTRDHLETLRAERIVELHAQHDEMREELCKIQSRFESKMFAVFNWLDEQREERDNMKEAMAMHVRLRFDDVSHRGWTVTGIEQKINLEGPMRPFVEGRNADEERAREQMALPEFEETKVRAGSWCCRRLTRSQQALPRMNAQQRAVASRKRAKTVALGPGPDVRGFQRAFEKVMESERAKTLEEHEMHMKTLKMEMEQTELTLGNLKFQVDQMYKNPDRMIPLELLKLKLHMLALFNPSYHVLDSTFLSERDLDLLCTPEETKTISSLMAHAKRESSPPVDTNVFVAVYSKGQNGPRPARERHEEIAELLRSKLSELQEDEHKIKEEVNQLVEKVVQRAPFGPIALRRKLIGCLFRNTDVARRVRSNYYLTKARRAILTGTLPDGLSGVMRQPPPEPLPMDFQKRKEVATKLAHQLSAASEESDGGSSIEEKKAMKGLRLKHALAAMERLLGTNQTPRSKFELFNKHLPDVIGNIGKNIDDEKEEEEAEKQIRTQFTYLTLNNMQQKELERKFLTKIGLDPQEYMTEHTYVKPGGSSVGTPASVKTPRSRGWPGFGDLTEVKFFKCGAALEKDMLRCHRLVEEHYDFFQPNDLMTDLHLTMTETRNSKIRLSATNRRRARTLSRSKIKRAEYDLAPTRKSWQEIAVNHGEKWSSHEEFEESGGSSADGEDDDEPPEKRNPLGMALKPLHHDDDSYLPFHQPPNMGTTERHLIHP